VTRLCYVTSEKWRSLTLRRPSQLTQAATRHQFAIRQSLPWYQSEHVVSHLFRIKKKLIWAIYGVECVL